MSQAAAPLTLTDEGRAELARWSKGRLPWLALRAEIVLVCADGAHLRGIYAKLGIADRSAAVRRARELRLLAAVRS